MKIKAVIFDLDGTLFDSIEDITDSNNAMLRSYGYPVHGVEKYTEWIGNGARKLVLASLPQSADSHEGQLDEYLTSYRSIYADNINNKSQLYPGIPKLLNYLASQQILLAINTNKPQFHTDLIATEYLKNWKFEVVLGQRSEFPKKPDPKAALYIAGQLNIRPENILFIGDSVVDIETAKRGQMIPLGVGWGYGTIKPMNGDTAQLVVNSPKEIIDLIEKINKSA